MFEQLSLTESDFPAGDLQKLSGVDFENLCFLLLQKSGFFVETTSLTGDGGIDLIAISDQPFFKGKYIIQCKRYAGTVGVAFVRDLYGVVTDEKANKGILITTGHFSASAVDFATGKNIELINGEQLQSLLLANELGTATSEGNLAFINHACFDKGKYDFYKSMIAQNQCTQAMGRDFLFDFLFGYFQNDTDNTNEKYLSIIHNGLADEYKRLFDWYSNKFFQKGKKEVALLPYYVRKYYGLAELYSFNLFDFVQKRYEILRKPRWYRIQTNIETGYMRNYNLEDIPDAIKDELSSALLHRSWDKVKYVCGSDLYEMQTLLSLFKYFGIKKGERYISNKLRSLKDKSRLMLHTLALVHSPGYDIATNNVAVFAPQITYLDRGKDSRVSTDYTCDPWINMKPYFDKYHQEHKEKIDMEIQKITTLFDALENN